MAVLAPDQFGEYCDWARSGDDLKRRHIAGRSKLGLEPQPPGMITKVVKFGSALATHLVSGQTATPEDKAARLAICNACDLNIGGQCTVCGCSVKGVELRASWAEQACPLDPPKWGPVDPAAT